MPLYLVRWPDLSCSLVRAHDEKHLTDLLDEIGDPGTCRWEVYRGPLFLNFELPIEYDILRDPITHVVSDVQFAPNCTLDPVPLLRHTKGEGTYDRMVKKLLRFAFPHLAACLKEQEALLLGEDVEDSDGPNSDAVIAALRQDLLDGCKADDERTREVSVRTDHEALVMQRLGLTVNPQSPNTQVFYYRYNDGAFLRVDIAEFCRVLGGEVQPEGRAAKELCYAEVIIAPPQTGAPSEGNLTIRCTKLRLLNGRVDQDYRKAVISARQLQLALFEAKSLSSQKDSIPPSDLPGAWTPSVVDSAKLMAAIERDTGIKLSRVALHLVGLPSHKKQ